MEVRCEPAIFVKAKLVDASIHLTRMDQIRNFYYQSILFYQGACSKQIFEADLGSEEGALKENGRSGGALEWDDEVVLAVRRGVEAMVEHYPWAAGRLRVVKQLKIQDASEEEEECLEVCINEDGGPGVQFVGARVNRPLHSLGDLSDPNPAFQPLFATVDNNAPYHSLPLVALQVSRFDCGGFCVSMSSNHALFDGTAASMFLQNMGSCARGKGLCAPLDLAPRELRVHPRNPPSPKLPCSLDVVHKKDSKPLTAKQASFLAPLVATKFVFTEHDIAKLRALALSKQEDCKRGFQSCSRLQVIIAYVWKAKAKCMIDVYLEDPSQDFCMKVLVNVRERIMKSIPKNYVGNAYGEATPSASLSDLNEKSLAFVVEVVQDAIENVSPECFQSDVDHLQLLGSNACLIPPSMIVPCLSNLGFYDIDFGWGKPTYFGRPFKQARNRVIIVDGNAQRTSLNILAAFDSEDELLKFQDALKVGLDH